MNFSGTKHFCCCRNRYLPGKAGQQAFRPDSGNQHFRSPSFVFVGIPTDHRPFGYADPRENTYLIIIMIYFLNNSNWHHPCFSTEEQHTVILNQGEPQ
jgi:hypothetical protein